MQTVIPQQQKVTYPYLFGQMDTSKFATYRRSGLLKNFRQFLRQRKLNALKIKCANISYANKKLCENFLIYGIR